MNIRCLWTILLKKLKKNLIHGVDKMKVYLYCTKEKPTLFKQFLAYDNNGKMQNIYHHTTKELGGFPLNGKIAASFDLNEAKEIDPNYRYHVDVVTGKPDFYTNYNKKILKEACLTNAKLDSYRKFEDVYAWHIENLEILDEPIDVYAKFYTRHVVDKWEISSSDMIMKAPKNWCYAEDLEGNDCIIMSINSNDLIDYKVTED